MNVFNSEMSEELRVNAMDKAMDLINFELEKFETREKNFKKLREALKEATESYEKLKEQDE